MCDEIRAWQSEQRTSARARLLAAGVPAAHVDQLLTEAAHMHEDQAACADRMLGLAEPVQLH